MSPPAIKPSAPLVALRGVEKIFPTGTVALKGLDLEVREGEFLSLLGPSGCGKSTALRIIAGLSAPTQGAVEWANSAVAETSSRIGFVFQEPTLMPWTTVFNNVRLPLKLTGALADGAAARVNAALERVGLEKFAGAYPRELSGGMRMRVSIARAFVTQPALLLMDEPFAALDEITRFKLNDDLLAMWQAMRTTVFNNVRLPLKLTGALADGAAARVNAALERVGLEKFASAYPREMSGGMRMRVSIARALVTAPALLLMDEPFAALDEITRFKLNDDLLQMWRAMRTTVVFVTHSVFESVYLSSRIAVMAARPGRVVTELEIDAPYPRDSKFRTSAEYAAFCRRTSEALARAMAAGGDE